MIIVLFLYICLHLTHLFWLLVSLCAGYLDYKDSIECMDSTIIYGQSDEFQSLEFRNILFILDNISYTIYIYIYIYIWDTVFPNADAQLKCFTARFHTRFSWYYFLNIFSCEILIYANIFEYLKHTWYIAIYTVIYY